MRQSAKRERNFLLDLNRAKLIFDNIHCTCLHDSIKSPDDWPQIITEIDGKRGYDRLTFNIQDEVKRPSLESKIFLYLRLLNTFLDNENSESFLDPALLDEKNDSTEYNNDLENGSSSESNIIDDNLSFLRHH